MTPAAKFFLFTFPFFTSYYAKVDEFLDYFNIKAEWNPKDSFDFIVVGGGAAGCVVARRLADAKFTVLLLEAAGNPPPPIAIPLGMPDYIQHFEPEVTYFYHSTNKYMGLSNNGVLIHPSGKMLGGSTSHNGLFFSRGSPFDYDVWVNATGDESWSYSNILPYFRKLENYHGNFSAIKNTEHGTDGPVTITDRYFPARDIWFEAGRELGYEFLDSNGPQRPGFSPPDQLIDLEGNRVSSYTAYILPVDTLLSKYLTVRRYSPVHRILFCEKTAIGVEYTRHSKIMKAYAKKEVIISAGPYISPILLMKSGIGPEDELTKGKIKPVQILPRVGENLQDHIILPIPSFEFTKQPWKAWSLERNLTWFDFVNAVFLGKGIQGGSTDAAAFVVSSRGKTENPNWPDLIIRYRFQPLYGQIACQIFFDRPYSRGRLTMNISATSMLDDNLPILDHRYLYVESDLDVVVEGIQFCMKAYEETETFKPLGLKYTEKPIRPCQQFKFRSENYWKCYVKHKALACLHTCGTCAMGKPGDINGSVVDPELRVHGVKNLRVIDSSIFPQLTNANNAAPTLVTAEKGVDGIIKAHK